MIRSRFSLASLVVGIVCATVLYGQDSPDFESLVQRADKARDAGSVDKAVGLYWQALHVKPDWKQGWWVLGSVLYDNNRFQEAAEAFLPLTQLDSDKSAGWAMAGLCEFEIKNYKDALSYLTKASQLGLPTSLYDVTQYHIELSLIQLREFDRALEFISRFASKALDNPKLVEAMGIAALRQPILPEDIPPTNHDLIMALGRAMRDAAASRGKEATTEFEALIAAHPSFPEFHYLYGLVLLQTDADKAVAAFQQELAVSPQHAQALISIASEYLKRNEFQTALPFAEKALAYHPDYFATHAMLGRVLVEGNLDVPKGILELEKAVDMAPLNPQSRLALAAAYSKAGRKKDAATQRAEFLRLRTEIDASISGPR